MDIIKALNVPKELKILVVDDMDRIRNDLIKILRAQGFYNIYEAKNGTQALSRIIIESSIHMPFQLIFSDINMPEMNGIQLLQEVRKNAITSKTPFILVSTESEKDLIIESLELGVDNYIIKPFTPEIIQEKINQTALKLSKKKS